MQARTSDPSLFPNFARRISNLIYNESVIFVNEKKNFWHILISKFSSTNFELETNRNLHPPKPPKHPLPNPQNTPSLNPQTPPPHPPG